MQLDIKTTIQRGVIAAALMFLALLIFKNHTTIIETLKGISFLLFTTATIIALFSNYCTALIFSKFVKIQDNQETTHNLVSGFFLSQITKYIPGKIWTLIYQRAFFSNKLSTSSIILANIEVTFLQLIICSLIGFSILLATINLLIGLTATLTLMLLLSFTQTTLLKRSARIFIRIIPKIPKTFIKGEKINPYFYFIYILIFIISFSASNTLLILSFYTIPLEVCANYVAILALSWVIGVLTIVIPAGIGARELAIILLGQYITLNTEVEVLTTLAIITRLWMIILDILGATIGLSLKRIKRELA